MKTLNNYISERLNPRNLGPANSFPLNATIKQISVFLKSHGFTCIATDFNRKKSFDKARGKVFMYSERDAAGWLSFANTTDFNIWQNNPMYLITVDIDGNEVVTYYQKSDGKHTTNLSEKDFIDEINVYFN